MKAIETKPDELAFYGPLADLLVRLGFLEQAEQVVREALNYAKEGDKNLFQVHALLKEHNVPLQYTATDLEDDLQAQRELGILPSR